MENLNDVIFYQIERTIKTYRMYAQKKIKENGLAITIDQWLVLKSLKENPSATLAEIGEKVFKDAASITRIVNLLVENGFVDRKPHEEDRRKFELNISLKGHKILEDTYLVVKENRKKGLEGISSEQIIAMNEILKKITKNCI